MKALMEKLYTFAKSLDTIILLIIRLILAYGFYIPAKMKIKDVGAIASWFESMNYPFPVVNAYLATLTEVTGVVLLVLGLATRLITIPLMVVMLVAIFTVHLPNGFEAGNNGFEIPLYYLILLAVLFVYGGGRLSIDNLLHKDKS